MVRWNPTSWYLLRTTHVMNTNIFYIRTNILLTCTNTSIIVERFFGMFCHRKCKLYFVFEHVRFTLSKSKTKTKCTSSSNRVRILIECSVKFFHKAKVKRCSMTRTEPTDSCLCRFEIPYRARWTIFERIVIFSWLWASLSAQ